MMLLTEEVTNDLGNVIATMSTTIEGDGKTPLIQILGADSMVAGFNDDGSPIINKLDDDLIDVAHRKFMAKAIKVQKFLTEENGIDPKVVNMKGAENGKNKDDA